MTKRGHFCVICVILIIIIFFYKPVIKNTTQEKLDFRLLTAFSQNHFNEAIRGCLSLKNLTETRNWVKGFMVAYLLENITSEQLVLYKSECPFVEIRKFPFEKYPPYIKNLLEYRWKPIIVQELLNEVDNILYFDSSIIFNHNSSETLTDMFEIQKRNFTKCGVRQFLRNAHTIFAATEPSLYKLFNFDLEVAKLKTMYGATFFAVTKNEESNEIINDWVKCAKEKHCMAPVNSKISCDRPKLLRGEYAGCHRFDQAVLAILLVQCSNNPNDYVLETKLIDVKREYIALY